MIEQWNFHVQHSKHHNKEVYMVVKFCKFCPKKSIEKSKIEYVRIDFDKGYSNQRLMNLKISNKGTQ